MPPPPSPRRFCVDVDAAVALRVRDAAAAAADAGEGRPRGFRRVEAGVPISEDPRADLGNAVIPPCVYVYITGVWCVCVWGIVKQWEAGGEGGGRGGFTRDTFFVLPAVTSTKFTYPVFEARETHLYHMSYSSTKYIIPGLINDP